MENRAIKVAMGGNWDDGLIARLEMLLPGCQVINRAHENRDAARSADILIALGMLVDDALLAGSSIKLVQQFGVGYDRIDLDAARAHGIQVANAPSDISGMSTAVAEHAVYLVLACARLPSQVEVNIAARRWVWTDPLNLSLAGKRAGLVGLGNIGSAVAKRLTAFDMELVGVRRTLPAETPEGFAWVGGLDRMDDLVATSDFIVITAPHNAASNSLVDAGFLARMKPGASIINVGRGAIVDEDALVVALDAGAIRAAGLDTQRQEPQPESSKLVGHPRIVLTPHIAGVTERAFDGTTAIIAENIRRLLSGQPLNFRIA